MTNSLRPHHPEQAWSHLNTTNRRKKKLLSCFSHFQGLLWGISPLARPWKGQTSLGIRLPLSNWDKEKYHICGCGCWVYLRAGSGKLSPPPGELAVGIWTTYTSRRLSTSFLSPTHLSFHSLCTLSKAFIHSCLGPCKSILTGELVPVSCLSHLVHTPQFSVSHFGVTPLLTASQWPLLPALPHLPPTVVQKNIIKTLVKQGKRSPHTLPAHTWSVTRIWDLLPFLLNGEAQP